MFWAVLIKHFIPQVLLVLFSLGCAAKTPSGQTEFGHYGGYPMTPYQVLGIMTVVFVAFLFFSSLIAPKLYDVFEKVDSPVPNKDDATIHVAPTSTPDSSDTDRNSGGMQLTTRSTAGVWPPQRAKAKIEWTHEEDFADIEA